MTDPERKAPAEAEDATASGAGDTPSSAAQTTDPDATEAAATQAAETDATEAVKEPPAPAAGGPAASPPRSWLPLVALLLAVAAALGGLFAWNDLGTRLETVASGQAALDQRLASAREASAARSAALERQLAEQAAGLEQQAAALERQRELAEQTYAALRAEVGQDRNRWVVAEIEYLMRSAAHRLALAGDVGAAIAALEVADRRLHDLGDPVWLGVRAEVADEIAALRAVPTVDVEGLALALRSLARRTETLPVLGARYRPGDARSGSTADTDDARGASWREALAVAWRELKGLVEVRRNDTPVEPMLAPELEYFLYQNMRLQLDAARLALLRGEPALYRESLRSARDWAVAYFDREHAATQALVTELDRLLAVDIAPALPEVGGALRALRAVPAYREARGGGAS
jgi:uroporphyrin-3 C-methyltransferase